MRKLQHRVGFGYLTLGDGERIKLKSPRWKEWLINAESFRFETDHGVKNYTARREGRNNEFWYGYKKVEGKLHKRYIGKSEELTQERLEVIAYDLIHPPVPRELPTAICNQSEFDSLTQMQRTAFERDRQIDELLRQKIQLKRELADEKSKKNQLIALIQKIGMYKNGEGKIIKEILKEGLDEILDRA